LHLLRIFSRWNVGGTGSPQFVALILSENPQAGKYPLGFSFSSLWTYREFARPLPTVINCLPIDMTTARTSGFETTSWTLVLAAAVSPTPDSRQALATLCQTYWHPVYAFIRRNGYDRNQSEDLTQGFFALLLEKNYLVEADRLRGKFRSFLLTAVKHFLANEWDREHAQKRGGTQAPVSIDLVEAEGWYVPAAVEEATPESLFERRWAVSLLERVLARLRAEFAAAGKADQFQSLSAFLDQDSEDTRYRELADSMHMSAGALRMAIHRMRRKYRRLLREEISETVCTPKDIDEEIRFLFSTLSE
jgi:RNA polymerase sigma-70 factor (ECF subfamily)